MPTSLASVLPAEALADGGASGAAAELAARAEATVRPQSTEEVAETLRWAMANGVGVLPVGSGERLRRRIGEGRLILLATDRLSGFEIYEPADVTLTAKAGTSLAEVNAKLGAHRQWLPYDPPEVPERTLGGLVSTGESGPVATGYGELRNHVLGATVVCGDGRVLRLGGRVVKNVAGFDLLRPVVGSRGRLGVITSVCLRAFPVPAVDRLLVFRASALEGLQDVARAVRTAPVLPASSVVWEGAPSLGGGAALLVRLHGALPTVEADHAALERHAGVAFDQPAGAEALAIEARDCTGRGAGALNISLLTSRLFEGLAAVRRRVGPAVVVADAYAGSARVVPSTMDPAAVKLLRGDLEALGGALSVFPGDGTGGELDSLTTPEEVELAGRLEKVFDPEGVFWPCRA